MAQTFRYAAYLSRSPTFPNTNARYYPLGDDMFPAMLEALEGAGKFIYLEYFIIAEGQMWGRMLEILERKAAAGWTCGSSTTTWAA